MSDTTQDAAEWLTGDDSNGRPEVTGELLGTDGDHTITVVDVTPDELDNLAGTVDDGEADTEAMRAAVTEYLVKPDVSAADIPIRRLNILFASMIRIWSGETDISPAFEQIQTPGNG